MASPGGTSSGSSSQLQNSNSNASSASDGDVKVQIMDERKRKRMLSNRESARRSRMRKQKHLDELMEQVVNLRKANNQLLNNINMTSQQFLKVEADNSILRAQMNELSSRLQSLNEINNVISSSNVNVNTHHQNMGFYDDHHGEDYCNMNYNEHIACDNVVNSMFVSPWNAAAASCLNQPIMASADMFHY